MLAGSNSEESGYAGILGREAPTVENYRKALQRLYGDKAIVRLAALPSREVLLAQLLGTFVAPMTTFLGAVNALLATPANMADAQAREKSKAS